MNFDSVVVLSFGGPEGPEDVMPFLRNVTRKRNVPDGRLAEVAEQYRAFGGISPINQQCRDLVAALEQELRQHNIDLPVYWGNRNWDPFLADTVKRMVSDGRQHALVFVTSAFSSYSGCRQYREDMSRSTEATPGLSLHKLRLFYNHPGFIQTFATNVKSAIESMKPTENQRVVFTAHSIPLSMAATSEYELQLHEAARLVAAELNLKSDQWALAFQSRSGPPSMPWLEPDINDLLKEAASQGVTGVVVAPLGFTSDHMEVMFDLDIQAKETADSLGLQFSRASTVGTSPKFVSMIRQLIEERTSEAPRLALGSLGAWPDECPEGHCALTERPRRPDLKP